MNRSPPAVVGIELGGTNCACLLGTGPADVRAVVHIPTSGPETTLTRIATVVEEWRSVHEIVAIGVAAFGPLEVDAARADYGRVLGTPKAGWSHVDLLAPFQRFEVPIALDSDVNGAALAEGRWGAARGLAHYVYITVGTGIGVGSIVHGRAPCGLGHSEAGHTRVPRLDGDRWPGVCPFHGDCVEGLASGPAIAARARRPGELLSSDDPIWNPVVHALAGLLHGLSLIVVPERIVMGGGVLQGQPHLLPRVRSALAQSLAGYGPAARIAALGDRYITVPALGGLTGALGAVALALNASSAPTTKVTHA